VLFLQIIKDNSVEVQYRARLLGNYIASSTQAICGICLFIKKSDIKDEI
jgi:hypothetical protein